MAVSEDNIKDYLQIISGVLLGMGLYLGMVGGVLFWQVHIHKDQWHHIYKTLVGIQFVVALVLIGAGITGLVVFPSININDTQR